MAVSVNSYSKRTKTPFRTLLTLTLTYNLVTGQFRCATLELCNFDAKQSNLGNPKVHIFIEISISVHNLFSRTTYNEIWSGALKLYNYLKSVLL